MTSQREGQLWMRIEREEGSAMLCLSRCEEIQPKATRSNGGGLAACCCCCMRAGASRFPSVLPCSRLPWTDTNTTHAWR